MSSVSRRQDEHAFRCMEIRGGSRAVEEAFQTPGLNVWIYSQPFEGAVQGGDLHFVSVCGGGVTTRLLLADVSGHGAEVAEFSKVLRHLMRKNINTKHQTKLVHALNLEFGEMAQLQRFATAIVATYLASRRVLTICNAGHPRPLWYRASIERWELLDKSAIETGNLPLGLDDQSPYHQFSVPLGTGDVVLFYTDALTEATDSSGQMLGEEGLLALARALNLTEPDRIGPSLLARVQAHRGDRDNDDDVTLISLVHDSSGPRHPSLVEKLNVYAKVFGLKDY